MRDPMIMKAMRSRKPADAFSLLESLLASAQKSPLLEADTRVALAWWHCSSGQFDHAMVECDNARRLLIPLPFGPVHAHEEQLRSIASMADLSPGRATQLVPYFMPDGRWDDSFHMLLANAIFDMKRGGAIASAWRYAVMKIGAIHLARGHAGIAALSLSMIFFEEGCYGWAVQFGKYTVWVGDQPRRATSPYTTVPAGEIIGDIYRLRGHTKQADEEYQAALERNEAASTEFKPRPYSESVQRLPQKLAALRASNLVDGFEKQATEYKAASSDPALQKLTQIDGLNSEELIVARDRLLLSHHWNEAAQAACVLVERHLAQGDLVKARDEVALAVGASEIAFDAGRSTAVMAALAHAELRAGNAWHAIELFQAAYVRTVNSRFPGCARACRQHEEGFGDAMFAAKEYSEASRSYERALEQSVLQHESEPQLNALREKLTRAREAHRAR